MHKKDVLDVYPSGMTEPQGPSNAKHLGELSHLIAHAACETFRIFTWMCQ